MKLQDLMVIITTLVQALLAFIIVGTIAYLAIVQPANYKDVITNLGMLAAGFWWGSSRSSQAKDDKPKEVV